MKNLPTFLISATVMVCCMFLSCNKEEDLLNPGSDDFNTLKSTSHHGGTVFTVSPSGNYNADADAIQTALNEAVTAGPGTTVQLTKGTFYLNKGIEVKGFNGYFKGAGKDKTILTTHDKLNFGLPPHKVPSLIKFRCGNISMSDMTITITDPEPCIIDNQGNYLPSVITITGNDVNPGPEGQTAKFTFNNLKFVGGDGNTWGLNYNILQFILATWESDNNVVYPLKGGYKITSCDFRQAYFSILTQYTGGPCIIGGDATSGNKFEETEVAAFIWDVNSSFCNTSNNFLDKIHWMGIATFQGAFADPCTLPLTDFILNSNDIKLNSYAPGEAAFTIGVYPVDYGIFAGTCTEPKINALISNNKIQIDDIGFAGILGQCNRNAIIKNNKIWGNGTAGIVSGIFGDPVNYGWVIKGNNVQGVNAQVAPIWLGPSTSNFLVYADKNDVLDEGTDNILIGDHKKRCDHPSLEMKEKMMRQHDMMKMHKFRGMK